VVAGIGTRGYGDISLRARLQAFFLAVIVLVGLLSAAVLATFHASNQTNARLHNVLEPAQLASGRLLGAVTAEDDGVRVFLARGDQDQLQRYRASQANELRALTQLQQQLRRYPALLELVTAAGNDAVGWRREAAEPSIVVAQAPGGVTDPVPLDTVAAKQAFTRLSTDAQALGQAISHEIGRTQRHEDAINHRLLVVLAASVAPVCLLALFAILAMERWVTKPLDRLLDEAARVAEGDLTHDVSAAGPRELGDLGSVVNQMRLRLLAEAGDALRARQALVQGGLAVLTLSAELGPSPVDLPDNVTVAARLRPAEGVLAGDWWDAVRTGEDRSRLALVIADVSGHGAVAGIVALRAKQLLLAALRLGLSPGDVLTWVAAELGDTGDYFVTCVVVELDPATGLVRWANAGHPAPLVAGPSRLDRLNLTGPLLGGIGNEWTTSELLLDAGDILTMFTDGITETRSPLGEEFGSERLVASVVRRLGQPLEAIADACILEVERYGFARVGDDLTVVLVGCEPTRVGTGAPDSGVPRAAQPAPRPDGSPRLSS
jgi:sigma-B regulation protein RsbU (phosphoserine phosphatase)